MVGGNGGSGVVIIRYVASDVVTTGLTALSTRVEIGTTANISWNALNTTNCVTSNGDVGWTNL